MIPTPMECLTAILPMIKDIQYKNLLKKQLSFINMPKNSIKLLSKVKHFQLEYRRNNLPDNILQRTCDFIQLEEKYKEWLDVNSAKQ